MDADDEEGPTPLEYYSAALIAAGRLHHAPMAACIECGESALDPDHDCYPEDDPSET